MKLTLKFSSFFAAVAISLFSAFVIIAQTSFYKNVISPVDKYFVLSYACTSLLLVSMLLLSISIFINRKQLPVLSKSLLWQTRVIVGLLFFAILCNIFFHSAVEIMGMYFFWWHGFEWLHYVVLLLVTAWLWQFAFLKPTNTFAAKNLGISGVLIAIGVGIMLLLMFISFIHVLITDHVIGFRTTIFISWIKPLSALALLSAYLLEQHNPSGQSTR
jgi:hypothetical protein